MVYHSNSEMDVAFVSKSIISNSLAPTPTPGFHSNPNYWQQNKRWRRVLERYDWGWVVFIDDFDAQLHATLVIVGDLDPTTGALRHGTNAVANLARIVRWYPQLVVGLRDANKPSQVMIPDCLGFNEPDHVCIGGANPKSHLVEPPCAWLARCAAIRRAAEDAGRQQQDMMKGKSPEAIVQMADRFLTKINKPVPAAARVKHEASAAIAANQKVSTSRYKDAVAIVISVMSEVASSCDLSVAQDPQSATPGDLYLVDRTSKSDYVTVYQATKTKQRRRAIASWRIRTRDAGFRVQLPVHHGDPLLDGIVKADISIWLDGAFKSCVKDVTPGERRMDHIKRIMKHLVMVSQ